MSAIVLLTIMTMTDIVTAEETAVSAGSETEDRILSETEREDAFLTEPAKEQEGETAIEPAKEQEGETAIEPVEEPAEESAEEMVEESAGKPAGEPVEVSAEEIAEEEEMLLTGTDKKSSTAPHVYYSTHVQTYGWMNEIADGNMSGTTGEAKRLEAIKIRTEGAANIGITYQTHVQTYGWTGWTSDGRISGTEGKSKRLEAIRIRLTGKDKDKYDICYCVHVQSLGWMNWVKNGAAAGTEGQGKRLEGICIMLVKKGDPLPQYPGSRETSPVKPEVYYRVHAQSYGWMNTVKDGTAAGTQGEGKRLEAFVIDLKNAPYAGSMEYRAHVQSIGWEQGWHNVGEECGTTGAGKRLEAVQIRLTGEMAAHYNVYYRTHIQKLGWLGWAKDGEKAGSEGLAYRMEAMQICVVPKGAAAPGSVRNHFHSFTVPDLSSVDSAKGEKTITVFGGFSLRSDLCAKLQSAIDSAKGGRWNVSFMMVDIRTGKGVAYNPDERFYGASTIKGFYIPALVFSNPASVEKWGRHMQDVLKRSNNFCYSLLRQTYGSGPMYAWTSKAGITNEGMKNSLYTWCTARDLVKMWMVNYSYFESGGAAETVASWMQDPNQSLLKPVLGGKYTTRSKGGWMSSPSSCFNDAGIVYAGNGPYVVAIMSNYPGMKESGLYGIVEALDACHNTMR